MLSRIYIAFHSIIYFVRRLWPLLLIVAFMLITFLQVSWIVREPIVETITTTRVKVVTSRELATVVVFRNVTETFRETTSLWTTVTRVRVVRETVSTTLTETLTTTLWRTRTLGCLTGFLITSYWTVREEFYHGRKVLVRDPEGRPLGRYREDFLRDVRREGWGKGDGEGNDGKYIGYVPEWGYIKRDAPLDVNGNPLIPWKTVAGPPGIKNGTKIYIFSFEARLDPEVEERLLNTVFVVSDRSPSITGKHIDIYVGEQDRADMETSPYSLYIKDAVICLEP